MKVDLVFNSIANLNRGHYYYNTRKHAFHMCLSWARSLQSMPPLLTSRRFNLLLSSHL